jgi:hypothetical protein
MDDPAAESNAAGTHEINRGDYVMRSWRGGSGVLYETELIVNSRLRFKCPLLPAAEQLTPALCVCVCAGKSKLAMSVHWALTGQVDERPVMDGRVGDVAFDVTAASDILGPASDIAGMEEEGEGGRKKRKARAKKTDQGTEVCPPSEEDKTTPQAPTTPGV